MPKHPLVSHSCIYWSHKVSLHRIWSPGYLMPNEGYARLSGTEHKKTSSRTEIKCNETLEMFSVPLFLLSHSRQNLEILKSHWEFLSLTFGSAGLHWTWPSARLGCCQCPTGDHHCRGHLACGQVACRHKSLTFYLDCRSSFGSKVFAPIKCSSWSKTSN